jgi:hypothetical protein
VANTTDPDSALMKVQGGFVQGYNAQAVVSEDQLVLAAEVTTDGNDSLQLKPMLESTLANLEAAGAGASPGVALADAGYWSAANAALECGPVLLIATGKGAKLDAVAAGADATCDQREAVVAAVEAGELTRAEAAELLGVTRGTIDALRRRACRGPGLSPKAQARHAMQAKLADPANRALYNQRGWMVEGVFGQVKEGRNCRRFMRRGLAACDAEWKLIHLTGNIRKAWRKRADGHPGGPDGPDGGRSTPHWAHRNRFCRHRRCVQGT